MNVATTGVADLPTLLAAAERYGKEAQADFGNLLESQLNWKPSPDRWSVAQCFDHLLTTNSLYFPTFERILQGDHERTLWHRVPLLPAMWGRLLIKSVAPDSARKMKTAAVFHPSSSNIDGSIISRFVDQQRDLVRYMTATKDLDVERLVISSPVSTVITYSLMDAYRIIVPHEKRHMIQAKRVTESQGFPN